MTNVRKERMVKTILVVDDSRIVRMMLKDILTKGGYNVLESESGRDAIGKYIDLKPNMVISDINMPGMNGIEVVKRIKKIDPYAIILMCSSEQQEMIIEALCAGATDFIPKPFKSDQVIKAVKKVLRN